MARAVYAIAAHRIALQTQIDIIVLVLADGRQLVLVCGGVTQALAQWVEVAGGLAFNGEIGFQCA